MRTPRGRCVTPKAYELLNIKDRRNNAGQGFLF